jgi:hypothetical protein
MTKAWNEGPFSLPLWRPGRSKDPQAMKKVVRSFDKQDETCADGHDQGLDLEGDDRR